MTDIEIAIIVASNYDLTVMQEAANLLDRFGVPYEFEILNLHKDPERLIAYINHVHKGKIQVLIAGASGAAHLPGMLAAATPLPVIGVPIKNEDSIDGLDAIYSMLQMPKGVPVATMALNNAENAALLALQILGCKHPSYQQLVHAFKRKHREEAEAEDKKLKTQGLATYMAGLH
jgi:5-(carboxyamino)imidazole ribonucleotide mutase